jgi:aldehyde:ferredoxin oxidoreductase
MFGETGYAGQNSPEPVKKLEKMIRVFYAEMGWDSHGQPTRDKLCQLEIVPPLPDADAA